MVNKGLENLYGTDGITPPKEVNSSKRGEPFLILHLENAWGGLPIVSEPDPRKEGRLRWKCTMCLDASVLPIGLRLLCAFIGKKKTHWMCSFSVRPQFFQRFVLWSQIHLTCLHCR